MIWLARLGVQPRPFTALVRTYLTLDLRGQHYGSATGAKAGELVAPLVWVVGQFLMVSVLLCCVLQARVPSDVYAMVNLSVTALMVFSAVLVEFREAAFDPLDVAVVGHRPITRRTWSAARFVALGLYCTIMTLALTIFPTIAGLGLHDVGVSWLVLYPWASATVGGAGASLAILLTLWAGRDQVMGIQQIAAWIQIVAIMALFYGGQLMLRNTPGYVEVFAAFPPEWVAWLPTTALGAAVAEARPGTLALASAGGLALAAVALGRLMTLWGEVAGGNGKERVGELPAPSTPFSFAPGRQRSGANRRQGGIGALVTRMLWRTPELQSRLVANLGMPLATTLLGLATLQYGPPTATDPVMLVLPLATIVLLASAAPAMLHHLTFGHPPGASWRLQQHWSHAEQVAVWKALASRAFAPFWLGHFVLTLVAWQDALQAVLHAAAGWLIVDLVGRWAAPRVLKRPIHSRPPIRGAGFGTIMVEIALGGALATPLATLWAAAARDVGFSLLYVAGLAVTVWLLDTTQSARSR